ncbi:MAG: sulfatase [Acidobacteria bacterium]|nr:sulfatase [Acidobacteriota bacterium]
MPDSQRFSRRSFCTASLGLAASAAAPASRPAPHNVVFILADDLGWADLGCYGADLHETPHLDAMARAGVRFTHAYSASPVCSPTRASIHTGLHPARLHMTIWREQSQLPPENKPLRTPKTVEDLPQKLTTVAEALHSAGQLTFHVGKWHLGGPDNYPENHGFDANIGGTHWGAPQSYFYPYRGNRWFGGEPRYVPGLYGGKPGEFLTDRLTSEALRLVDTAAGRPFFLSLNFHNPHTPIEGKPEQVERYQSRIRPGLNHRNAAYAAMLQTLDENVGRVLLHLKERKLAENTLVVFTSDNGGYIGKNQGQVVTNNTPLRSGKGSLYEGGVRVPLIAMGPGVAQGGVCRQPVISCDLYPTLITAGGGRPEPTPDALPLTGLFRNPDGRLEREALYFHYPHYYETTTPVSAVRAGRWKLLEYFEDGRTELYDLESDPGETRDIAKENPAQAAELLAKLKAWRIQVDAQVPTRA